MTGGDLPVHVLLDAIERDVPRAFDHDLHVVLPGDFCQLAEGVEFGELGGVVGVGQRPRPQTVAE